MKLKTLYKKNKNGKTLFVELSTRKVTSKNEYHKVTRTGIVGNTKIKTSKILVKTGKNAGKSNETTPKVQAHLEIQREYLSLFFKGYKDDLSKVVNKTYNTFLDETPMPMLLKKYSEKKFKEGFVQKKYDGVRCIVEKFNGKVRLKSREGRIFNIPHILKQVTKIVNKQADFSYDGELYIHGVDLHDITRLVKLGDPKGLLNYHIYDSLIKDLPFKKRRNILLALDTTELDNIFIDPGHFVKNEKDIEVFHENVLDEGYEGTIFCNPDADYDFGFRSDSKMKIKPRETKEFRCVMQYWNRGKMSNQTTLVCETSEGKTFHVKLKGTSQQREKWAQEFDEKVKNKMITVEYRKLSKHKVPMEGVGVAIRDYE